MANLIVMVGLQGSGKSTKAKELAEKKKAIVLSSDETRKEHPDWDNTKVFNYIYKQMRELLNDNKNVILDATNTTIKARKPIFEALKSCNPMITAYIMTTNYETCIERVKKRNEDKNSHYVPLEVIEKYLHSYQIPFYEEGFNEIIFDGYDMFYFDKQERNKYFEQIKNFDQKSKYHSHTLGMHSSLVFGYLFDRTTNPFLIAAGAVHDIGKLYTQTFKDGEAHYYNHENVGTYYLLSHIHILNVEQSTADEVAEILFYVNYHMMPFNWKTDKARDKWKAIFGEEKFNNLLLFHEADTESC